MEFFESSRNYKDTIERPVYGYLLHNDEQRFEILEKYPNISAKGLSIAISNNWRSLSEEKKNEYAERAKELNWKCLSEYEKSEHLEHVKELAIKLKEHHENPELDDDRLSKKSRHLSYYNESDYESDEDVSEIEDYNICTQESYQYDSNTNSSSLSSTSSINLPEPSSAFTCYLINCTPRMLQCYPEMNLESVKQILQNNWSKMSPEQRAPWVTMNESYNRNNRNLVPINNNNNNNNSEDDSNYSSDYDFDDLLNTEDDSEVGESNQSYLQELIHAYNNHKKSQHIDPTHIPSYFRSEPWIQPSKVDVANEELVLTPSVDITQCQSEVVVQKDLSIIEEMVPEHCSLLDTQLDVHSSSKGNISTDTYDYILSSTQKNDQVVVSKPSEHHNKPLETQFWVRPYDKENDVYASSLNEKEDPFSAKLAMPLQPRNVNQNEQNPNKLRNAQQIQQDWQYGLKVPVPYIGACEHYQRAVKLEYQNKYSRQTELNKSINNKWKQMGFSERKKWEEMEKEDKERYEKEKEEYLTSQYDCFLKSQEGIPLIDWL